MPSLSSDGFFEYVPNDMYLQAEARGDDEMPPNPQSVTLCGCCQEIQTCCCSLFVPCVVADAIGAKVFEGSSTRRFGVDVVTGAQPAAEITSVVWCGQCCAGATEQAMAGYSCATPILHALNSLAVCFLGYRADQYLHSQKKEAYHKEGILQVCLQSFFCTPCYLTKLNRQTSLKPVRCPCC